MVGCGGVVSDAQALAQDGPHCRSELHTSVVTMTSGTTKQEIHPATRASAQAVAVVVERGIASTHLVERSIIVMMWVWPSELACRGPTRSTWMWENRCVGTRMCSTGVVMLVVILALWHRRQSRHHWPTSAAMPFQTKRLEIILREARIPGWARE